jgi:small subunit ribosomal protein S21
MPKHYNFKDGFMNKKGLSVFVNNNNINSAISLLKKKVNDEGLKKDLRDREHHMTKQQRKRRAQAAAIRRQRKMIDDKYRADIGVTQ